MSLTLPPSLLFIESLFILPLRVSKLSLGLFLFLSIFSSVMVLCIHFCLPHLVSLSSPMLDGTRLPCTPTFRQNCVDKKGWLLLCVSVGEKECFSFPLDVSSFGGISISVTSTPLLHMGKEWPSGVTMWSSPISSAQWLALSLLHTVLPESRHTAS